MMTQPVQYEGEILQGGIKLPDLTCTFTGHRASKLPWGYREDDPRCRELKRRIYDAAEAVCSAGVRPVHLRHGRGLRPVFL